MNVDRDRPRTDRQTNRLDLKSGSADPSGPAGPYVGPEPRLELLPSVPMPPWARWAAAVLIVVVVGAGVAWYSSESWRQGRLDEARKSFATGDYAKATSALQSLLAKDPRDMDAVLELARVEAAEGRSQPALESYGRVVKAEPGNAGALYEMALLERLLGRPDEAIPHLEAAVSADPENLRYASELAKTYTQTGRIAEAADRLRKAVQDADGPKSGLRELYLQLARLSIELHDTAAARAALGKVLRLVPNDAEAKALLKRIEG